jgi:hypothetical protein
MNMMHGVYVGPLTHLQGKTASLRLLTPFRVLAQFDDVRAVRDPALLETHPEQVMGMSLSFGWHEFSNLDFRLVSAPFTARPQRDHTQDGAPHDNWMRRSEGNDT